MCKYNKFKPEELFSIVVYMFLMILPAVCFAENFNKDKFETNKEKALFHSAGLRSFEKQLISEIHKVIGADAGGTYDGGAGDQFGWTVAIDGDYAVVGAPNNDVGPETPEEENLKWGQAYIFKRDQGGANNWGFWKALRPDGESLGNDDQFGQSVAIEGDIVVVGCSRYLANAGAIFIFSKDQGGPDYWGLLKKVTNSENNEEFGWDVAISGSTIIASIPYDDYSHRYGAANIYGKDQGGANNWGLIKKITASVQNEYDRFGMTVDIDGTTAVCGVPDYGHDPEEVNGLGAVYVFEKDFGGADNWGQAKLLSPADLAKGDQFGDAVAIDNGTLIVGVPLQNSRTGSIYVFGEDQGGSLNWGQITKKTASDAGASDYFGCGVAIDGSTALAGAKYYDAAGVNDCGAVYSFDTSSWTEGVIIIASDKATGDSFGESVNISGTDFIIGAPGATINAKNSAGAAYIFGATSALTATTSTATNISGTTAMLKGIVNPGGETTTVTFEYGTTDAYGETVSATQSPLSGTTDTSVSKTIGSLNPYTTYHYRVVATNTSGTVYGLDMTFKTLKAPAVITAAATDITATGAVLNGGVNPGALSTTVTFEYGKTILYGSTVTADESPITGIKNVAVSKLVKGLSSNTTYHFRVVASNANGTSYGDDMTFKTYLKSVVTTLPVTDIGTTTATGHGNITTLGVPDPTQHGVCWGLTATPTISGNKTQEGPVSATGEFTSNITGLTPNTTYYVRAYVTNAAGTSYGTAESFDTLPSSSSEANEWMLY